MRSVILVLAIALPAFATVSITVTQPTTGQALLSITGCAGPNTLQMSENPGPGFSPPHPDVDPTIYSGSNIDSSRADTYTTAGGVVKVTLGHLNGRRSLAAHTTYYVQVTGCSSSASTSFTTTPIPFGNSRTEPIPFDSTKLYNADLPPIDWSVPQSTVVEPTTSVKHTTLSNTFSQFRTGGPFANSQDAFAFAFADTPGDWTNLSTIVNGSTSTAATSVANSAVRLYIDTVFTDTGFVPNTPHLILQDIGIAPWASRTGTMTAVFDLIVHGVSCGTPFTVTPTGSFAHVNSGNTNDPDQDWGPNFPSVPFRTWNPIAKSPCIRQEDLATAGSGTITGSTLTLSSFTGTQYFSPSLVSGDKIRVVPSSCTNNMCTVSAYNNNGSVTLVETPGNGSVSWEAFPFYVKLTASGTGTLTIGAKYKIAGSEDPTGNQALGDTCSDIPITAGDGKVGYDCYFTSRTTGAFYEYWMANDGTARPFAQRPGIAFDGTTGDVMWQLASNGSGMSIYKLQYTGNHTTSWSLNWNCTPGGCDLTQGGTDSITVTNVMDHATSNDIQQQVTAKQGVSIPAYDSTLYGSWNSGPITIQGSSGHYVFVQNLYGGQGGFGSGSGSWTAVIDVSSNPAQVVDLIHTVSAANYPMLKYGSSHNVSGTTHLTNILFAATDPLYSSGPLQGGPYQAQVKAVLQNDGVTWNTTTTLPQMDQLGTATYLRTCPTNPYGYTECVTVLLPQGGVCNTAATAGEISRWPCPWSGSASQMPVMAVGDHGVDTQNFIPGPAYFDYEHFVVLQQTQQSGTIAGVTNPLQVVFARNAAYEYCSTSPWHSLGTNVWSADAYNQTSHANGWSFMTAPVGTNATYGKAINTCGGGVSLLNVSTHAMQNLGRIFGSHDTFDKGLTSGNITYATNSNSIYNVPYTSLGQVPYTTDIKSLTGPSFHSAGSGIGAPLQSYPEYHHSQTANASDFKWSLDANFLQDCMGPGSGCTLASFSKGLTSVTGNVYTINPVTFLDISTTAKIIAAYKSQNLIGWAGHNLLHDITGPSANIDTSPWGMCWALVAGWCHSGSAAGTLYINATGFGIDGNCYVNSPFSNNPCVVLGLNAPFDGIRQYRISANDTAGVYSRVASMAMRIPGQNTFYAHATDHPSGKYFVQLGTNYAEGFMPVSWIVNTSPYDDTYTQNDDFTNVSVSVPAGNALAEVRFGYSRYGGLPNQFRCTPGALTCITRSTDTIPGLLEVDGHSGTSCASGCSIPIPATGPNLMTYQTFVSNDGGSTWASSGDMTTVRVGVQDLVTPCSDLTYSPTSYSAPVGGGSGTITLTVTNQSCTSVNTSTQSWLTITSATGGCAVAGGVANCTGNGTFNYSVAANPSGARTAAINPDSLTSSFAVSQAGVTGVGYPAGTYIGVFK